MTNTKQLPEELELHQKEELLKQKQEILTELELTLSTLQARLGSFEVEYYLKIGSKYVQIDQLQATLDKILASKIPYDKTIKMRATESQEKAKQSAHDAEEFKGEHNKKQRKFEATNELKTLYRELVKLLHPDLTLDLKEKERRHGLMQEVNEAYQSGDVKRLHEILDEEKNNPENIKGEDIGSSLVRVIRKIAQVEKRINDIEKQLDELHKTDLYILFETITKEMKNGNNLLEKISTDLNSRITFLQHQIEHVNR